MIFTDDLSLEDFEDELGYMAHLWTISSGLPYEVLVDYGGKNRARPNNSPRIMICLDRTQYDFVPISIDEEKPVALIECEIPEFETIANWIDGDLIPVCFIDQFQTEILVNARIPKFKEIAE